MPKPAIYSLRIRIDGPFFDGDDHVISIPNVPEALFFLHKGMDLKIELMQKFIRTGERGLPCGMPFVAFE